MHIICPHCTTSYAIDLATLGAAGRTVRCSRCKEVWLARPEDATEVAAPVPAMAEAGEQAAEARRRRGMGRARARRRQPGPGNPGRRQPFDIERLAGSRPTARLADCGTDWPSIARHDCADTEAGASATAVVVPAGCSDRRRCSARSGKPFVSLPTVCAAMGALVLALMIWRVDVVRLLPQTATFYKMVGLDVNLRGLMFKDVKITTETVEGKPVLVIEGVIVGEARKPVELPRLRFSVRDAQGAEIYAWNAVLEQPVLKPGERAWFKSRLASPPPEGRNIDVRFFSKRDIAGGNI